MVAKWKEAMLSSVLLTLILGGLAPPHFGIRKIEASPVEISLKILVLYWRYFTVTPYGMKTTVDFWGFAYDAIDVDTTTITSETLWDAEGNPKYTAVWYVEACMHAYKPTSTRGFL